jgi:cytochrome P450
MDHEIHRIRRAAVAPFFSKRSVAKLEPVIIGLAEQLCRRLSSSSGTGCPVVLNDAFSCFATDVITEYSFARSYGFLRNDDFLPNLRLALKGLMVSVNYAKQCPWLFSLLDSLPE